nr:hypothetical protein [Methylobacterium sp. PvR107]
MRRVLLSTVLLVLAGPAGAEDFSGFYAGINAGYAAGHGHDRPGTVRSTGSAASMPKPVPGAELPPSARDAAAAIRSRDAGGLSGR